VPLRYFGQDLVAFRDDRGAAHVLDAHCPHLGAHLGYGGSVERDCITCPFHGWSFDQNGACVALPGGAKPPPKARLRVWTMHETNGMLLAHYHPRGATPTWRIPEIAEYTSPDFHPYERRRWRIRSHVQELAENIVDAPHFVTVHGATSIPTMEIETRGHELRASSTMQQLTPRGPVDARIDAVAHGIGFWVLRFTGIVETVFTSALTPIDEEHVDVRFSFMVTRRGGAEPGRGVGAALIGDVVKQVEQDIPIWENKIYRAAPALAAIDKPITIFRRWAAQFISPE
jgi:nitrite reductase/ring-hydroxylating ferredoxin subunit